MSLSNIVFKANPTREIEVLGKKLTVRGLTARDTLDMDIDLLQFVTEETKDVNLKDTVKGMVEYLAAAIVSIDGQIPENKEETKSFLLDQEQGTIIAIFAAINAEAVAAVAETKKSDGTQA